jgi:hypothetical protein
MFAHGAVPVPTASKLLEIEITQARNLELDVIGFGGAGSILRKLVPSAAITQ